MKEVDEVVPVVTASKNKTEGLTARQRWWWAFNLVAKVKKASPAEVSQQKQLQRRNKTDLLYAAVGLIEY
jgi:hypothetical protein